MKKQAYIVLMTAALLATIFTSTHAETATLIEANIPFNFVIGERALPGGKYTFALVQIGGSNAVKIQSVDGHITAFIPTRAARMKTSQSDPKLVFNHYIDHYFLSQIYGLEESTTQQLAKSRAEERLAKSATDRNNVFIAAHKQ